MTLPNTHENFLVRCVLPYHGFTVGNLYAANVRWNTLSQKAMLTVWFGPRRTQCVRRFYSTAEQSHFQAVKR